MPKTGFQKYADEYTYMDSFYKSKAQISGFSLEEKSEFANKIKTGFTFTRTSLDVMIIGSLLSKYTLEQYFNPNEKEKAEIAEAIQAEKQKLYAMVHKEEPLTEAEQAEFRSYAATQFVNVALASKEYVNKLTKDNYAFANLSREEKARLYTLGTISNDASQEMAEIKPEVAEKYKQLVKETGGKEPNDYYTDISDKAMSAAHLVYAQVGVQPAAPHLQENIYNHTGEARAEDDRDELINVVFPYLLVDSALNDYVSKQEGKDFSNIYVPTDFLRNIHASALAASAMIPEEKKELVKKLMLHPATKEALLTQVFDTDKSKVFSVNPETGEVSFDPLFNNLDAVYDLAYGKSELSKKADEEEVLHEYSSNKHHQFANFTKEQKADFTKGLSTGYTTARTSFDTLFWGRMLLKGYSLDELLDYGENSPEKMKNDLADVKKEFLEKLPKEEDLKDIEKQKKFDTYAAEAHLKAFQESFKVSIERIKEKGASANLSLAEKQKNRFFSDLLQDSFQECGKITKNGIVKEADFEGIINEQNPGNKNAWNEFQQSYDKGGVVEIQSAQNSGAMITKSFGTIRDSIKNKTPEEISHAGVWYQTRTTVSQLAAQKITDRVYAASLKKNGIGKIGYVQTYQPFYNQAEDLAKRGNWEDEVFNEIFSDRFKTDAFMNALDGDITDICTIKGNQIADFDPINKKALEINNTPSETLAQEKIIRNQIVNLADEYLETTKRKGEIERLSDNDKIALAMKNHWFVNESKERYGKKFNDDNPNASKNTKINNFIKELAHDALQGKEMYASIVSKDIDRKFHKISNHAEFTFEAQPVEELNTRGRDYKLRSLEELKEQLDKSGTTRGDSDEYKKFKKCLDESIVSLKKAWTKDQEDKVLNELSEKADGYYMAKLFSSKNSRRTLRFNAASIIRNINQPTFENKLDMKQNILNKMAYLYAKDRVANGTPKEKEQYRKVVEPYNKEQLSALAETFASRPGLMEALAGKDDKQLKTMFDNIKEIDNFPTQAKTVVKAIPDKKIDDPAIGMIK